MQEAVNQSIKSIGRGTQSSQAGGQFEPAINQSINQSINLDEDEGAETHGAAVGRVTASVEGLKADRCHVT
jgi:hypothetical protein